MASRWWAVDWFRFGAKGGVTRVGSPTPSKHCLELVGRAQVANALAARLLHEPELVAYGAADAVACELAREAIYWALRAHREFSAAPPPRALLVDASDSAGDRVAAADTLETLWEQVDRKLLTDTAHGVEGLEELRAELLGKSFVNFAELAVSRRAKLAAHLQGFVARLLEPLDVAQRGLERIFLRRMAWLAGFGLLLLGLVFLSFRVRGWWEARHDRAISAPWTTSSKYSGECECKSPAQSCTECPNFFFHTLEDRNPWLVFDLGNEQQLSGIVVENRRDCCFDRALPLVVEVSSDNQHWKEVTRRSSQFDTWHEGFPTVHARWVKLHVPHRSILHLARVRLLP